METIRIKPGPKVLELSPIYDDRTSLALCSQGVLLIHPERPPYLIDKLGNFTELAPALNAVADSPDPK